jgi:hypothetical protein
MVIFFYKDFFPVVVQTTINCFITNILIKVFCGFFDLSLQHHSLYWNDLNNRILIFQFHFAY